MKANSRTRRTLVILAIAGMTLAGNVSAQDEEVSLGTRWEMWLAATSWPGINDLQQQAGGSFDTVGLGLGGPFVGLTWDAWAGQSGKNAGLALGFEVHFVDFDTVRDEDIYITPVLGPDAGSLDGPIYMLQVGYSSR